MLPPDDQEAGAPSPPGNDNLEGLAAALGEIAAQPFEDSDGPSLEPTGRKDSEDPKPRDESRRDL